MTEHVVAVVELGRSFGRKRALDSVSLEIPRGSVFGLVGENGAGKTTLLKHLLGLLKAREGSVRVFGLDPVADPVGVLGRTGYLSEDRDLPEWMTVAELMNYYRAFFPRWDAAFADELRDMFELLPGQRLKTLSRGQLARAGLLVAVAHRPELLVLDEPSSGLDPIVRRDILAAIIGVVSGEGRTVLFSSHLLDEVQRVSDHVAMLHAGRLVLSQPLDDVLAAHRRLTVRFAEPLTAPPVLTGALSCQGSGREWTVICNGQRLALEQQLVPLRGEIIESATPSLDEVFVAQVRCHQQVSHSAR